MSTTIIASIIAAWIIGIPFAYNKSLEKDFTWYERFAFSATWPLTAFLYAIHWIHNKL